MNPPFPFLVGCGRSGSTLLRAMLDAHPAMTIPGESYFVEQMLRRRDRFTTARGFDRETFERELFSDLRFRAWNLRPEMVQRELDAATPLDLAEAVRATYRAVAAKMGTQRYGDKTPGYALCMDEIAGLLPEAVFVHLVRDPRDVAASYRSVSWGPRTLVSAAAMWRRLVGAACEAGARLGPDRYVELRYEDLVADPAAVLESVCTRLELDFDPVMLDYHRGPVVRRSVAMEAGSHTALLEPVTTGRRDWSTDLPGEEAARVGALTDELAMSFGYTPSPTCRRRELPRLWAERGFAALEQASLSFRRTRLANRLRTPWRRMRRRATVQQLNIPADGVS